MPTFALSKKIYAKRSILAVLWKDAGVDDRGGLENRCSLMGTQGSNPCLSAIKLNNQAFKYFTSDFAHKMAKLDVLCILNYPNFSPGTMGTADFRDSGRCCSTMWKLSDVCLYVQPSGIAC